MKSKKIKIGGKSITLKPFLWGDFVRLEDEYGVDIKKIGEGFSAKDLNNIYWLALQLAEPTIAKDDLHYLDLNHALFAPETLALLFGGQTKEESIKVKND